MTPSPDALVRAAEVLAGRLAAGGRLLVHGCRSGDVTLAIAYRDDDPPPPADVVLSDRPPEADAVWVTLPSDPAAAKVAAVLSYHVLWELAQLFLDATPSTGPASGTCCSPPASSTPSTTTPMWPSRSTTIRPPT